MKNIDVEIMDIDVQTMFQNRDMEYRAQKRR
jgi:hypothetical protein